MRIEINENEEELKKALAKIFLQDDKEKSMKPNFLIFAFSVKEIIWEYFRRYKRLENI